MSEHPSIAELLERLNTEDESHDLEAKRSETDVGKSTLETISAFSNEPGLGGGYILFGVAEGEGAFAVLGVRNPKGADPSQRQSFQRFVSIGRGTKRGLRARYALSNPIPARGP